MPKEKKKFKGLVSAAVFIVLEVAAVNMLSNSSSLQNIWINKASHRSMAFLWKQGESVRNYFSLEKQNASLCAENARLSEEVQRYQMAGMEAIPSVTDHGFLYIPASIVKMSRNSQRNYIILDKGSADGVTPQSGILSPEGIVGIVDAVDEHYSYGLTLMNVNVSVSARAGDGGAVGPLSWDGVHSDRALLKELPLHFSVEPGDTVRTSGYSAIFPSDIALGIAGETRLINGTTNQVEVHLFQNFSSLKHVTIVKNLAEEEIQKLENGKTE